MAHVAKYAASAIGAMLAHYLRTAEKRGHKRDNIDNDLISADYVLGGTTPYDPVAFVQGRVASTGKKPHKNAIWMCDCVVTAPRDLKPEDTRRFFEAEYAVLAGLFGAENVVGAYVHMDEPNARPHMHFAFVPVTEDGRLSAKSIVSRKLLQELHPRLQEAADKELGYHVSVLLDEEQRGEDAAKYVDMATYKAATAEIERLQRQQDKLVENLQVLDSVNSWLLRSDYGVVDTGKDYREATAADVGASNFWPSLKRIRQCRDKAATELAKVEKAIAKAREDAEKGKLDAAKILANLQQRIDKANGVLAEAAAEYEQWQHELQDVQEAYDQVIGDVQATPGSVSLDDLVHDMAMFAGLSAEQEQDFRQKYIKHVENEHTSIFADAPESDSQPISDQDVAYYDKLYGIE